MEQSKQHQVCIRTMTQRDATSNIGCEPNLNLIDARISLSFSTEFCQLYDCYVNR